MGWSRPAAAGWPLQAVVAENGAVALWRPGAGEAPAVAEPDGLHIAYAQDDATRLHNAQRLRAVLARVLASVPDARAATDSAGRVTDIAIDHAEHAHLDAGQIAQVVALMREAGMTATVSSIHVNGWFGSHDKLSGARWIVRERLGRDLDAELDRWVYVGDSTNDQVMFGHFPHSVGVANLMDFADRLHTWPAWLASAPRGRGFAEVAEKVLLARR
jgi:hydroxymethylpyrimidine pyrophosphatase-like HAD family hydrolase